MVPSPIFAVGEIETFACTNGLKCRVNTLKSLKGSSEINNALPSGQSTFLFIKTI